MYLTNQLKLWSSFLLSKKNAAMSIFGSTLLWTHALVWVCVSHKCPKLCLLDRRVCAPLVFVDATQSSPIEVVWVGHASDVFPHSSACSPSCHCRSVYWESVSDQLCYLAFLSSRVRSRLCKIHLHFFSGGASRVVFICVIRPFLIDLQQLFPYERPYRLAVK